jgi:hypothetical protein
MASNQVEAAKRRSNGVCPASGETFLALSKMNPVKPEGTVERR